MSNEVEMGQLVAKLPERYQPIFGFPQLDEDASRQCSDRLGIIRTALEAFVKHYGRPLRLLDLGCAQGFFTMSVADFCESVVGIDFLTANVDVCNAARDAAGLQHVRFEVGEISEFIGRLEAGQFDVVLGLSVFHHLCHAQGWSTVIKLLKKLAVDVDVLVLELADAREPLYWASSLPTDPVDLIRDIGFIYPLGSFATHLSDVERTLYYCSDRIWHLGSNVTSFESWTEQSHEFAGATHQGTRRYFFAKEVVAKTYRFVGLLTEHNRTEFANERAFFECLAPELEGTFVTPELISSGATEKFGHLVMTRMPGHTLAEVIVRGAQYDALDVVRQVLAQLVQLEASSLYHRDVRVWNVLIDDMGKARLIDFGAICAQPGDNLWPFDVFASFLIFVGEVASKSVPRVYLFRRPILSSVWLMEPFRSWFDAIWSQSHKEWSFAGFLRLLEATQHKPSSEAVTQIHPDNWALWRGLSERLLSDASDAFHQQREAIATRLTREEVQHAAMQLQETQHKLAEAEAEIASLRNELQAIQSHLHVVSHSFSWSITRPLRRVNMMVRCIMSMFKH
jgi:O-antigen chain-terminating methyltransferase